MTGLEQLETPRENDLLKRMTLYRDPTRGMIKDQQKRDAAEFGADYALDQRAQSLMAVPTRSYGTGDLCRRQRRAFR